MTPVKPWTIILVIPKWRYIVKRYFDDSASSAIGAFSPTFLMVRFAPLFCAILINVLCFMALQTFVESVVSEAVSNTNKQSQLNWTSCYNERSILVFKPEVITLKKTLNIDAVLSRHFSTESLVSNCFRSAASTALIDTADIDMFFVKSGHVIYFFHSKNLSNRVFFYCIKSSLVRI